MTRINSPKIKKNLSKSKKRQRLALSSVPLHEFGAITESSLKLFFSLFVALVATISLARLLPYHFAQSGKLKELRAQVKETEQRVDVKRQQLQENLDLAEQESLMELHSPKIAKNRVRLFWQEKKP